MQHVCLVCDVQVGYAAVFFWEYFGPMALYAAIYFLPQLAYPTHKCVGVTRGLPTLSWMLHLQ